MLDTETRDLVTIHTDGGEPISVVSFSPGGRGGGEELPSGAEGSPQLTARFLWAIVISASDHVQSVLKANESSVQRRALGPLPH